MCSMVAAAWKLPGGALNTTKKHRKNISKKKQFIYARYSMSKSLQTISSLIACPNVLPRKGFWATSENRKQKLVGSVLDIHMLQISYNIYFIQLTGDKRVTFDQKLVHPRRLPFCPILKDLQHEARRLQSKSLED